ncbi:MAG: AAA family ATPase [Algicola sp.]|nr:AAA family ATPase [Algicola sp.]
MHISKIEIINLWGKEKLTLEFPEQVTFLTGVNGCGKSTLLKVIYDALNDSISKEGVVAQEHCEHDLKSLVTVISDKQNTIGSGEDISALFANLLLVDSDLEQLQASPDYQDLLKQSHEIKHIVFLLDVYFASSGKQVTRDEDNKITLKMIGSDTMITWHRLSRGEKTLLYLFFVVLLYKSKVSVFLFDEPAISMHVKWQHNLIKDLAELAPDNQFIIATHSPSLVQNSWLGNCLEISVI